MKTSAFVFVAFLAFTPALISTAPAADRATASGSEHAGTGTAFDIAQQYTNRGKFGGVTSGNTGTTQDVARDSLRFLGALHQIASTWLGAPIEAKGD